MFETITKRALRRGALAGIAVAAAAVLAACSSSGGGASSNSTSPAAQGSGASSSAGGSSAGLMHAGVLTVGMNLQFKPEMYLNNGKPAGYDVDLLNKLAASMGVKLDIQNLDFNGLIPGLQAKKFDLVSVGLTPNADREKVVDFTRSYVPYASILAVKASDNSPAQISTYNKSGVTITALQGSSDETLAKASFPKANVSGLADQNATLLEVQTGRAQGAVLEDYILAQYLKANPGQLKEAALAKPLSLSYGSWAVQKGDTALTNELNAFLCKSQSDGSLASLYKQDFGATLPAMPGGC
jgi:ABC-type amino acid transport substrate-binding protein